MLHLNGSPFWMIPVASRVSHLGLLSSGIALSFYSVFRADLGEEASSPGKLSVSAGAVLCISQHSVEKQNQ